MEPNLMLLDIPTCTYLISSNAIIGIYFDPVRLSRYNFWIKVNQNG